MLKALFGRKPAAADPAAKPPAACCGAEPAVASAPSPENVASAPPPENVASAPSPEKVASAAPEKPVLPAKHILSSEDMFFLSETVGAEAAMAAAKSGLTREAALLTALADARARLKTHEEFIKAHGLTGGEPLKPADAKAAEPPDRLTMALGPNLARAAAGIRVQLEKLAGRRS